MSVSLAPARALFRACVVSAVRNSQDLMERLVEHTRMALLHTANHAEEPGRRHLAEEAARLLGKHGAAMSKSYPMALLEEVSDAPRAPGSALAPLQPPQSTHDQWSLMGDEEVEAQVQLSKSQQVVSLACEAALAEFNALACAAQGLDRLRPERNPLRPENYLRAIQQVMLEVDVIPAVREMWMGPMREHLGTLLSDAYREASAGLRRHGIEPVTFRRSGMTTPTVPWATSSSAALGGQSGFSSGTTTRASLWDGSNTSMEEGQEAWMALEMLQQMLAHEGDPYDLVDLVQLPPSTGYSTMLAARARAAQAAPARPYAAGATVPSPGTASAPLSAASSRWAGAGGSRMGGLRPDPSSAAADLVTRMMDLIAQDERLLPAVRTAVQGLETPLRQLVRHDAHFFSDATHPARRLLDELTERALAYPTPEALGFSGFMRLADQAVAYLRKQTAPSARHFQQVLDALHTGWEKHATRMQQLHSQQTGLASTSAPSSVQAGSTQSSSLPGSSISTLGQPVAVGWSRDAQNQQAVKIAAQIRALPELEQVPVKAMDFVTGTWANVIARSQLEAVDGAGEDPNGFLVIVPSLLWSVQPVRASSDIRRLQLEAPALRARLQEGLSRVGHPAKQTQDFLRWMERQHSLALELAQPSAPADKSVDQEAGRMSAPAELPSQRAPLSAPVVLDAPAGQALSDALQQSDELPLGSWVILESNRKQVITQLTWASPQRTLYLFTGQDGSTQSMTRRVRDRLMEEGSLRRTDPPQPTTSMLK